MLEDTLYILVSFIATVTGALTGIGGGIVLKTFVDAFSNDPIVIVSFYTTIVVFTMCIVSIYKQLRKGFQFNSKVLFGVSLGSIIGGYLGEYLLNIVVQSYNQQQVQLTQSIILFIVLIFLILYTKIGRKKNKVEKASLSLTFLLGLFLGGISIFLSIGGGPLNISLFVIILGYRMKDAAIYSIATVFFSQISKIISIIFVGSYGQFDLKLTPILILIAIAGGYIGTTLNQKLSNKKIEYMYMLLMKGLSIMVLINIFKYWS